MAFQTFHGDSQSTASPHRMSPLTNRGHSMRRLTRVLGSIALVGPLAACAPSPIVVHTDDGRLAGSGVVEHSFHEPHHISLALGGETYVGEWKPLDAPDHPHAHSHLHWRQVGRVETTLTSAAGHHVDCNWLVENLSGRGTCEDEQHHKYDVVIGGS